MYARNDIVIYGKMGACEVTDIRVPEHITGARKELYYVLRALRDNCLIYVPVDTKVFMRPALSAQGVERLIDQIPEIQAEAYHHESQQELARHYEEAITSPACADLVRLTMSIYAKKQECTQQHRKLGPIDQRYMKQAEEMLFGEIAIALGIRTDEVPAYIAARVEGRERESA